MSRLEASLRTIWREGRYVGLHHEIQDSEQSKAVNLREEPRD